MCQVSANFAGRYGGFTLIELLVSMVIATILAGFVAMMIGTPIDAYVAQTRRAELSDSAATAMRILGEDARKALPDSLRAPIVNGIQVLEMIEVSAIANYQTTLLLGDPLNVGQLDSQFDTVTSVIPSGPIGHVVVGHSNANGTDVYAPTAGSGVITAGSLNGAGTRVTLSSPFQFTINPTTQRAYLVGGVTRYQCDPASRELRRSRGSPIAPAPAGVVAPFDVIASDVVACSFRVRNGTAEHGGVAIVEITISRATNGNSDNLTMFRQFKVENIT